MNPRQHLKSFFFDDVSGEVLCSCGCGYVIEDKVPSMEKKDIKTVSDHTKDTGHHHSIGKKLIHDNGLSTAVGISKTDHSKKPISSETLARQYKINRLNNISIWNYKQVRLVKGLIFLERFTDKLQLSDTVKFDAANIFRKIVRYRLLTGHVISNICLVLLWLSCKRYNLIRDWKEFAKLGRFKKPTFTEVTFKIRAELEDYLNVRLGHNDSQITRRIQGIVIKMRLSQDVLNKALNFYHKLQDMGAIRGTPKTNAGSIIKITMDSMNQKFFNDDLEEASGVTMEAIARIANHYRTDLNIVNPNKRTKYI